MQISDEIAVTAIDAGCSSEDDGTSTLHAFNCYCGKCKKRMRAALEAALGAGRGNASEFVKELKDSAYWQSNETYAKASACIEDLAAELKELLRCYENPMEWENNDIVCSESRATLERWGLK